MKSSPSDTTVIRKAVLTTLAFLFCLGNGGSLFTANEASAQVQWPNGGNVLDEDDAQEAYEADRRDSFRLDGDDNELAREAGADPFGTRPLVNCEALDKYPEALQALQGLYNDSLTKYDGVDRYNLKACVGDGSVRPEVVTNEGQEPVADPVDPVGAPVATQPSLVHSHVTYVLAGGVPIGVNAFGIVAQRQTATDGNDQSVAAQSADGNDRRHDRHKKKNLKNGKDKGQTSKQKIKK